MTKTTMNAIKQNERSEKQSSRKLCMVESTFSKRREYLGGYVFAEYVRPCKRRLSLC